MTEKFVRYSDGVPDLPSAFTFVMGLLDEFDAPTVEIHPYWPYSEESGAGDPQFTVTVSGHVA